jgi:hypothetical protein
MTSTARDDDNTRYTVCYGVRARRIGDETVILVPSTGNYLSLNATGSQVWEQLIAGATPAQMASALAHAYGLASSGATRDVAAVLDDLLQHGVIIPAKAIAE